MPEKTSISTNIPTRDLLREVCPSWMEYDAFMLELLRQYDPSAHRFDPRSSTYDERLRAVMEIHDVDSRVLDCELDLPDVEDSDDATVVSS